MGLDVTVWKEELVSRNSEKGETVIKRTDVLSESGWELGHFLGDAFLLGNCVAQLIDLDDACERIKEEIQEMQEFSDSSSPKHNNAGEELDTGLLESLQKISNALEEGRSKNAEYHWELWW